VNDLSAVYFDVSKDRLYTAGADSPERRSAQAALYRVAHALVRLMAPLLAFTADEAWAFLKRADEPESVHLAEFPKPEELAGLSPAELADWEGLLAVREQVTKALEVARQEKLIGAPLEAQVHLAAGGEFNNLLHKYFADLPGLFIVSAVELVPYRGFQPGRGTGAQVHVTRADGVKCERCWKFKTDVGVDPEFSTICFSCSRIVAEMLAAA
jgi:isoleucyl-tRNA synthetase